MYIELISARKLIQAIDSIPWVRCASGNVFLFSTQAGQCFILLKLFEEEESAILNEHVLNFKKKYQHFACTTYLYQCYFLLQVVIYNPLDTPVHI